MSIKEQKTKTVTYAEFEDAIRKVLSWIGENPDREGLIETPKRISRSFQEFFSGYKLDPYSVLNKTFSEVENYEGMVILKNAHIESRCEHHMEPIIGSAHIAYIPDKKVVGISKLSRVAEIYAKRLQIQERLTSQIANTIYDVLRPKGVAVTINAVHFCIAKRGIKHDRGHMMTSTFLGCFKKDYELRKQFLEMCKL